MSVTTSKNYYKTYFQVFYSEKDKRWQVIKGEGTNPIVSCETKTEAVEKAIRLAEGISHQKGNYHQREIIVHKINGAVDWKTKSSEARSEG